MGTLLISPDDANWAVEESHYWHFSMPPVEPIASQVFIKQPYISQRRITQTMIVCGDCAGDGKLPRKTFLTQDGRCDGCGGRSFVLAVNYQFQIELARRINELVS